MPLNWYPIKLLFRACMFYLHGLLPISALVEYSYLTGSYSQRVQTLSALFWSRPILFLKFIIYYFILFIFLQHDTYIHYIKVPFTGLSTYIALHYLLTVHLGYNWYLCHLHCSTYTTYNVIMHTYLEAYHLHTHKKEKLLHKKINSYERQKG